MVLNKETLEIPRLEDIIFEHEQNFKPILKMQPQERIAVESVAGQIIQNTSKQSYEMFLSMQIMMASLNPNTAIGKNLDLLGMIRDIKRLPNEDDETFRKRITGFNKQTQNQTKKDLLTTQLENVAGVTKASVIYKNGEIWAIVSGGTDEDIAKVMRDYSPIGVHKGNSLVSVDCLQYKITRARELPIRITVEIDDRKDACICSVADRSKIIDLVMEKHCDYTAGSALMENHFISMLGKEGFNAKSVYFEVDSGKVLTWDNPTAPIQDPCTSTNLDDKGGWDDSCFDVKCLGLRGNNLVIPSTIIPLFCKNLITVKG